MASTHPDPDVQAPADALPKHHALHDWLPSANDLLTKEAAEQLRMQESRPPGTEEEARRSGWGIVEQIRDLIFFAVSDAQKLKVKMLNSRIMNCDDHVREKLGEAFDCLVFNGRYADLVVRFSASTSDLQEGAEWGSLPQRGSAG